MATVELKHPDIDETTLATPAQARVLAKSGWQPVAAAEEIPADESAPTPTNTEE